MMKKIVMCLFVAGLLLGLGCAKEENKTIQPVKKAAKAAPVAKEAKVKKEVKKPSFSFPTFDTYTIGQKFENKGYEGKPLVQDGPFSYHAELDEYGIIEVIIFVTKDGTIAAILKDYELDRGLRDLAQIFEKKLNVKFQEKGAFGMVAGYVYEDDNIHVVVSTKNQNLARWVSELNDYTGVAEVEMSDKKLFEQVDKAIDEMGDNALQEKADNFKL